MGITVVFAPEELGLKLKRGRGKNSETLEVSSENAKEAIEKLCKVVDLLRKIVASTS